MRFSLTKHAQEEILRRHISKDLVDEITQAPDQIVEEHGDIMCYQSLIHEEGSSYLLRVMVNPSSDPAKIVTVYKTKKIVKYWRAP